MLFFYAVVLLILLLDCAVSFIKREKVKTPRIITKENSEFNFTYTSFKLYCKENEEVKGMKVALKHSQTGLLKEVKLGFSWTTFFFGFFPALLRGDIKWAAIMVGLAFVTCGLSYCVFPFVYNSMYIRDLLEKGYVPETQSDVWKLESKKILVRMGE